MRPVYDARAEEVQHWSPALKVRRTFYIYVPPELRVPNAQRAPAIYLLRGHEREWINLSEDPTRNGRNVIDVYEELRRDDLIGPMLLVFPGVTNADGSVHSMGVNMRAPEREKDPTLGTGRFFDYLTVDLPQFVERNYPALSEGRCRGLDGFSLGGFMSTNLGLQRPDMYLTVGAFDGLYFWDSPRDHGHIAVSDGVFKRSIFDAALGVPRDYEFGAQNNAFTLMHNHPERVLQLRWLIEYGAREAEPSHSNYYRGARLSRLLERYHGPNELAGELKGGIHTWAMADDHMRRALPLHWKHLKAELGL